MIIIVLVSVLITILYFYGRRNHSYWKLRGVTYEEPLIFFGSTLKNKIKNVSFSERFVDMYREYPNEKYVGFFEGNRPSLLIRDPDIVQQILINDFRNFHYRGANAHKEVTEPLMKNLFNVDGDTWKLVRQRITPAFTSAKLKAMFPLIVEQAEKLIDVTEGFAQSGEETDSRELLARYTTDFIGACGFGVNVNSQNDANSEFRKLGKLLFTVSKRDVFVSIIKRIAPNTFKRLHFFSEEVERLAMDLIKYIMAQRDYKPTGRNDFIDMMLELKGKGMIVSESLEKRKPDGSVALAELEIDDELIVAQVFVFFAAGFETSSSSSSYLLHLFALNPEKQERCQLEIDEVLARYNGKLCFDAVKEMKYLEMSFKEALRMYPPVGWLQRRCANKCQIPGTDVIIDENVDIMISTEAMHTDEKYFDNPDEFRPERFDPENIGQIKNNVYMPFGAGPRACIGERLGIMQSLAGVAAVLSRFSVVPSKNTVLRPKYDPTSITITTIHGGLPLQFIKRGVIYKEHRSEILMKNIFHHDDDVWKLMRQNMTPEFSSGKLKAMFPEISDKAEKLIKFMEHFAKHGKEVDVRELMSRYTTDIIAACGFGIDADALSSEASEFRRIKKRIFNLTPRVIVIRMLKYAIPELTRHLTVLFARIESRSWKKPVGY